MHQPSYSSLHEKGELRKRIKTLEGILARCRLCPRACEVNRLKGEEGYCRAGADLMVSSAFSHFGEEPPLVGSHGSGTIFLTHCNLKCVFCQNYDISHLGEGRSITSTELAQYMIGLQQRGCHNINFVTPTHYVPQIVAALPEAIELTVLFEDEHLIVVDKPAGMVVHPAAGHSSGTLVNALLGHCKNLSGVGGALRPGIVHRLDKLTSGVMVASKTDAAHAGLAEIPQAAQALELESGEVGKLAGHRHPLARRLRQVSQLMCDKCRTLSPPRGY